MARTFSTGAIAIALTFGGAGAANAQSTSGIELAPQEVVSEFEAQMVGALPATEVAKYEALTERQQAQLVTVVTSGNPAAYPEVTIDETSWTTAVPSQRTAGQSINATTYDVTANYRYNVGLFNVNVGYFLQVFKYKTGSNKVVSTTSCNGSYGGFAGLWSISASSSHNLSGAYGECYTYFNGSIVYKGSAVQMNKEMYQKVSGPGIVTQRFRSI